MGVPGTPGQLDSGQFKCYLRALIPLSGAPLSPSPVRAAAPPRDPSRPEPPRSTARPPVTAPRLPGPPRHRLGAPAADSGGPHCRSGTAALTMLPVPRRYRSETRRRCHALLCGPARRVRAPPRARVSRSRLIAHSRPAGGSSPSRAEAARPWSGDSCGDSCASRVFAAAWRDDTRTLASGLACRSVRRSLVVCACFFCAHTRIRDRVTAMILHYTLSRRVLMRSRFARSMRASTRAHTAAPTAENGASLACHRAGHARQKWLQVGTVLVQGA